MALDPLQTWIDQIKALPDTASAQEGTENFANCIGDLTSQVQAGDNSLQSGSGKILTFANSIFALQLFSMLSPMNAEWAQSVATAWQTAMLVSVITPGTVQMPSTWTASTKDVDTVPSTTATILTLSAAYASLLSDLQAIDQYFLAAPTNGVQILEDNPKKLAEAFRNAALAFQFQVIGEAQAGPATIQVPVVLPAQ